MPIKSRTKSFEELKQLALEGLNYHWGRNRNHVVAKNVEINGAFYEVFVNTVNTTENAILPLSINFVTNSGAGRSRNWEASRILYFNVGYLDFSSWYNVSFDWRYWNSSFAMDLFKETVAHEIGHTILKAYGGTFYSYGYKGSVNTVTQEMKSTANEYPKTGEIDIMPYYSNEVY